MEGENFKSVMPIQIRFGDIDALGHINNNNYLSYFDLGKAGYFEDLRGYAVDWTQGSIVIARIEIDFLSPIFYKEEIEVESKVVRLGNKSGDFYQRILNRKTREQKCICKSVFVYYDAESMKSVPIPAAWKEVIEKYEEKKLGK